MISQIRQNALPNLLLAAQRRASLREEVSTHGSEAVVANRLTRAADIETVHPVSALSLFAEAMVAEELVVGSHII